MVFGLYSTMVGRCPLSQEPAVSGLRATSEVFRERRQGELLETSLPGAYANMESLSHLLVIPRRIGAQHSETWADCIVSYHY